MWKSLKWCLTMSLQLVDPSFVCLSGSAVRSCCPCHFVGFPPCDWSSAHLQGGTTPSVESDRRTSLSSSNAWCRHHLVSVICKPKTPAHSTHQVCLFSTPPGILGPPSEVHPFQDHAPILISNKAAHGYRQSSRALDSGVPPFLHHLPFRHLLSSGLMQQLLPDHLPSLPYPDRDHALSK